MLLFLFFPRKSVADWSVRYTSIQRTLSAAGRGRLPAHAETFFAWRSQLRGRTKSLHPGVFVCTHMAGADHVGGFFSRKSSGSAAAWRVVCFRRCFAAGGTWERRSWPCIF